MTSSPKQPPLKESSLWGTVGDRVKASWLRLRARAHGLSRDVIYVLSFVSKLGFTN